METSQTMPLSEASSDKASSQTASEEKAQAKALLAEARNTKQMLEAFSGAVQSGTFHGSKMLDLAKGLAFLEAIMNQNHAHIKNLQARAE